MPSHLSSVGFTQGLDELLDCIRAQGIMISAADPRHRVRLLGDPSGAVIAYTETPDGTSVCLTPALDATTTVTVVPTGFAEDPSCPLCSRLLCEIHDERGATVTAFAVAVADLGFSRNAFRTGRRVDLRLGAYTYSVTVFGDEAGFRRHEESAAGARRRGRAPRSLIATGLFRPPDAPAEWTPTAHVLLTGHVVASRWARNTTTGSRFAVLTVDTHGCRLDLAADPRVLEQLPPPGSVVDAHVGFVALYAGKLSDLIHDPAARDPAARDPAAHDPAAHDPAGHDLAARDPAARDPARDGRVLAALVSSATPVPAGVVATCADADLRWQLRRFPHGRHQPDRVADLPGWPEQTHVVPEGAAVLCGTSLLLFDGKLRPRRTQELPANASVSLVHGRSVVWVVLARTSAAGAAPDAAGMAAQQRGDVVHEFEVWRLPVTGTGPPDRYPVGRSAIYRRVPPEGVPLWEGAFRDGPDAAALWLPLPGESEAGRPVQHLVEIGETGPLRVRTVFGPEWDLGRLRLDGVVLTADTAGLRADDDRIVGSGASVRSRWFTAGDSVFGVISTLDGSSTSVVELERGARVGARPLVSLNGHFDISAAPERADGAGRVLVLAASWATDSYLFELDVSGALRLRDRVAGHPTLLSAAAGQMTMVARLSDAPGVNLHTGKVVPAGQMEPGTTYVMLSSLVEMAVGR